MNPNPPSGAAVSDGGPFHPVQFVDFQPTTGEQVVREQYSGISLRDWFAGQALASADLLKGWPPAKIAHMAYQQADAMLKERNTR